MCEELIAKSVVTKITSLNDVIFLLTQPSSRHPCRLQSMGMCTPSCDHHINIVDTPACEPEFIGTELRSQIGSKTSSE